MLRSEHLAGEVAAQCSTPFVPAVRDLLDHIASELAGEYIRLMETAAEEEMVAEQLPKKTA